MAEIKVYDADAEMIKSICDQYAVSEPELIKKLLDVVRDEIIYLHEWL